MADAPALGAGGSNPVEVQVLSPAPKQNLTAFSKPEGGTRGTRGGLKLNRTLECRAPRPLPAVAGAKTKNFPYLSSFPRRGVWGEPQIKMIGNFWVLLRRDDIEIIQ